MFEYDPAKSATNRLKHGIDFDDAQALWLDEQRLELGMVDYGGEARNILVGRIGDRVWTAIVTYRGDRIRIISVRRARRDEEMAYLG